MSFNVFAYSRDGDQPDIRRDGIPPDHLNTVMDWLVAKRLDTILVELTTNKPLAMTHHFCDDSSCPGGC